MQTIEVNETNFGDRIDVFITDNVENLTRSHIQKLINDGMILLNDEAVKVSKIVKCGDIVKISIPELKPIKILPQDIPLDIIYQDSDVVVLNKQQGLTVHPANNDYTNTLVNALLFHIKDLSGINGDIRPGIVHRLDKNTSGLMVVAKNDKAHNSLATQISTKVCRRVYVALVEGVVKTDSGVINQPIGRSLSDRKKMAVVMDGRQAITNYKVLERFKNYTLVEFELKTGRTHQIRVHTKYLGYPIVGDETYGFKNQKFKLDGQLLHSYKISFFHPQSGEEMQFEIDIPSYFKNVLKIVRSI